MEWWKDRIAYQIYPRSFQDSNGDGIGDIRGIISRLDELQDLGVGILWLSPVYRSPDADNGYDISDYRGVDPKFGTMADMEALFREAAKRDIRIIMDMVINHTSDEHEWFKKSRASQEPWQDYYIWHPGKDGKPPNNWTGFFMEKVWEFDEDRREYYLHLFHRKQPDLNYRNPAVIEEIKGILRFWIEKGAAGFRFDVINVIYKSSLEDGKRSIAVQGIEHYKSQEGNHAVLRELRRDVLDPYGCLSVGETVMVGLKEARELSGPERKELDMLFYFEHLEIDRRVAHFIPKKFRAAKLLEVLAKWQGGLHWNAVYLENHDQPRIVSHFGAAKRPGDHRNQGGEPWRRSAKLLGLLELTLRGTVFIYQGQEIGMTNFDFTSMEQVNDVESRNLDRLMKRLHIPAPLRWRWIRASSRDNARTPLQWTAGENAGFTQAGVKPWLGINRSYREINYETQKADPGSVLNFYKGLIRLRRESRTLREGSFEPLPPPQGRDSLIAYERRLGEEAYRVILNFSGKTVKLPSPWTVPAGRLIFSSAERKEAAEKLLPWEGVLLKLPGGGG
jgi:oligo-1,6-glucosidase